MLDHILIESDDETHHRAYEVEHTGEKAPGEVFIWKGSVESLEKRIRLEYRGRKKKWGEIKIKRANEEAAH